MTQGHSLKIADSTVVFDLLIDTKNNQLNSSCFVLRSCSCLSWLPTQAGISNI